MNKPKRNDKSAEQPLRKFPEQEWPVDEVREVARMLYARAPFKRELWRDQWRWSSLARQAFDFLDNLDNACKEIARQRGATDAAYRRAESRSADGDTWPLVMPFDKAVRTITREKHTKRAEKKFEAFVLAMPRYFGGVELARAQIKRWRKDGMTRAEVTELQSLFDIAEKQRSEGKEKRARAKKRKPWPKEKRVSKGIGQKTKHWTPEEQTSLREELLKAKRDEQDKIA